MDRIKAVQPRPDQAATMPYAPAVSLETPAELIFISGATSSPRHIRKIPANSLPGQGLMISRPRSSLMTPPILVARASPIARARSQPFDDSLFASSHSCHRLLRKSSPLYTRGKI